MVLEPDPGCVALGEPVNLSGSQLLHSILGAQGTSLTALSRIGGVHV